MVLGSSTLPRRLPTVERASPLKAALTSPRVKTSQTLIVPRVSPLTQPRPAKVPDVPPFRAAAIRFFLAAAILLSIAMARRVTLRMPRRQWRSVFVLGLTMMGVPYGLLFWAESRISSSMTAVLFSSCPLFVGLFTRWMSHARVPRRAVLAMLVAVGSMATLFYTELSISTYVLLGGAAVIAAVISSSWASVFAKRELGGINPLVGTGIQFLVSATVLLT